MKQQAITMGLLYLLKKTAVLLYASGIQLKQEIFQALTFLGFNYC